MIVHALGGDLDVDSYLRGDEPGPVKATVEKYMPQIIIAAAVMIAVFIMAGTVRRRT